MRRWTNAPVLFPAAALVLFGVVAPAVLLVRVSLFEGGGSSGFGIGQQLYVPGTWTLDAYRTVLTDDYAREILGFSAWLTVCATTVTMAFAVALARWIYALGPRIGDLVLGAIVLPKLANVLVVVYGLKLTLSNAGTANQLFAWLGATEPIPLLGNFAGVLIGQCILLLPYPVLLLVTAYRSLDARLEAASRGLGANAWQSFVHVTLPLTKTPMVLATMLTAVWSFGAFVAPYLLGSPEEITVAVDVQRQAFENLNWPRAAAMAVIVACSAAICTAAVRLTTREAA